MRWNSDLRRVRSSEPGTRRLCSRRVKRRETLSRVRSGDSPVAGKTVTAILNFMNGELRVRLSDHQVDRLEVNEDATRRGDVIADSAF